MKLGTKLVSIVSSAALVAALATGCTAGGNAMPRPDYIPEDIIMETAGIAGSTAILTVDGVEVPAEEFLYWVTATADQLGQYMGEIDWEADMGDGTTVKEYMLNNATETVKLYQVVVNHANEMGVKLGAEEQKRYDEDLAAMKTSLAAQLGAEDEAVSYVQWLASMGISPAGFERINKVSYLFQNIRNSLYGEGGKEAPTAEVLNAWADETGTLRAKHILIKAVASADGADDGMAAALEKADSIRAELKEAGDTESAFDELMTKYSEDVDPYTGQQNCGPAGYTFQPGEMVEEFYNGTKALAVNAVSEPVQSTHGYHIILRLGVEDAYADDKTNALADQWMADAVVEKTEAYEALDLGGFYTKLGELRTVVRGYMYPAPPETPAPTGTPAPEPADSPVPTATPAAAG